MSGAVLPPLYAFMVCAGITFLMSHIFLWQLWCYSGAPCMSLYVGTGCGQIENISELSLAYTWRVSSDFLEMKYVVFFCVVVCY